jgi:hypothetical protein
MAYHPEQLTENGGHLGGFTIAISVYLDEMRRALSALLAYGFLQHRRQRDR